MSLQRIKGFTLVELMFAVIIMAILASLAYPYYMGFLLKSRRSDALATLAHDQMMLEDCYSQNFSYDKACSSLPAFPQTSAQGFYQIILSNLSAASYVLTATPRGSQISDTLCISMSVNQAGVKTASDSSGSPQTNCWNPI